jgi:hypothetical protein
MEISQENRLWSLPEGVRESCLNFVMTLITAPGAFKHLACPVCGSQCQAERNARVLQGMYAGMAGIARPHDRFVCPNAGQEWHAQAYQLIHAIDDTPSQRVAALMRLDLEDLLAAHRPS